MSNHQIMTKIGGQGFLCVASVPGTVPHSATIADDIARLMSERGESHIITDGRVWGAFLNGQRCPGPVEDGQVARDPDAEYIAGDTDWPECRCGNDPANSGFAPCLPDGTVTTPLAAGPWDGIHIVCLQCGLIIDQDTLRITGQHANPDAMAAEAEAADAEELAAGND
jgi:hypothetical protein